MCGTKARLYRLSVSATRHIADRYYPRLSTSARRTTVGGGADADAEPKRSAARRSLS